MIKTTRYVRKPLYVEAVRITEQNFVEVAKWCQGEIRTKDFESLVDEQELGDHSIPVECFIRVRVHNPKNFRQTQGYLGDWILYTNRGYKIYTPKAFNATFYKAENGRG